MHVSGLHFSPDKRRRKNFHAVVRKHSQPSTTSLSTIITPRHRLICSTLHSCLTFSRRFLLPRAPAFGMEAIRLCPVCRPYMTLSNNLRFRITACTHANANACPVIAQFSICSQLNAFDSQQHHTTVSIMSFCPVLQDTQCAFYTHPHQRATRNLCVYSTSNPAQVMAGNASI